MEGGDNPNPLMPAKEPAEASAERVEDNPLNSQENDNDSDDDAPPPAHETTAGATAAAEEADLRMSLTNVTRVMRKVLPAQIRITDDVKRSMQDSLNDFISYLVAEANQRRRREIRKTLVPQDLILAFNNVGLRDYVEPLSTFLRRHRELESRSNFAADGAGDAGGIPPQAINHSQPVQLGAVVTAPPRGAPSGYYGDGASSSAGAAFGYPRGEWSGYSGGSGQAHAATARSTYNVDRSAWGRFFGNSPSHPPN